MSVHGTGRERNSGLLETSDKPHPAISPGLLAPFPSSRAGMLNEKQLAARWNISVRTLQAARVKGGGVPFIRIGRAVRYRLEDVLAYEEAQRRTSTSEPA